MSVIETETPTKAALMEHQILEHVKQALRVTLGWRTPPEGVHRKVSSVQFTLKSFLRHFERVMELEEQDGYFKFIVEKRPSLSVRVDQLEHDHREFRNEVGRLLPRVDSLSQDDFDTLEEVCRDIDSLLEQVDEHDRAEIDLLQESMLTDVGGEG
jgi:hypothetical protein